MPDQTRNTSEGVPITRLRTFVATWGITVSVHRPSSDEKAARCTTPPGRGPQISVDALRLIELLNRTSAVLKSQKSDALVHSDPVLAILTTHGYLHPMTVSNSLAVVRYEDFSDNVTEHWRAARWSSFPGRAASRPSTATAGNETPGSSNAYSFDTLFQQKREGNHQAVAGHSQYMRRVFADTAADVAMFQDRGFPQAFGPESGARYHVFMPFFGGPDDRVALAFAVQLCRKPPRAPRQAHRLVPGSHSPTRAPANIRGVACPRHNVLPLRHSPSGYRESTLKYCFSPMISRTSPPPHPILKRTYQLSLPTRCRDPACARELVLEPPRHGWTSLRQDVVTGCWVVAPPRCALQQFLHGCY